jgi:hypothetical protein
MYTTKNFKTKKALKEAVRLWADWNSFKDRSLSSSLLGPEPPPVTVYQPNSDLIGSVPPENGLVFLEGPHYPKPHTWYAQATLKDGIVVRVK